MATRTPLRRRLVWAARIFGGLVLLLVVLFGAVVWSAFGGTSDIVDGRDVAPGVRIVKDGFVSIGVLDTGDGRVALIDAGNDPKGKALLAELSRRGVSASDVAAIFVTHGHQDHTATIPLFPKADVYALSADVPLLEGKSGGHGPLTRMMPVHPTGLKVTHALQDGEAVDVGKLHVEVFAIPGHTAGSAAYLVNGVVFLGDSARGMKDGTLTYSPWAFSDDSDQNRASLRALSTRLSPRSADIVALCPAHTACLQGLGPLQTFAKVP